MSVMTGRSLHDALLSVMADFRLRRELPAAELGEQEAAVLARVDADRLSRMARFLTRHYYRERLVRLYSHSAALARRRGLEPSEILDGPDLAEDLDTALLGSAATADRVAARIEEWFRRAYEEKGGPAYWPDLTRYEGAMFRTEAGRRVWTAGAAPQGTRPPRRSASARVVAFDIDVPALATRLEKLAPGDPVPWAVPRSPTRLLFTLSPRGILRVVRSNDALEGFLKLVDGSRSTEMIVECCGMDRSSAGAALRSLIDIGAIEE
ncbi:MAG TPA: hypothetical protein VGK94_00045 [Candidatus Polarisedimenticolia bacterium]|jgi:hypothetical protein